MSIPKAITCPDCRGEGWYYEGDEESQCELCAGDGEIIIREYAEARNLSEEDAYYSLKAELGNDDDE